PTADEIAEERNIDVEKVREILKIAQDPVSLENPVGEEEDSSIKDFVEDESMKSPVKAAEDLILTGLLLPDNGGGSFFILGGATIP
ncbi:MAG: hypothetical protein J6T08_03775, partial [Lentisphaeria bacterium]|nr:hypothetical protein [Lentisphaeria bacterium]